MSEVCTLSAKGIFLKMRSHSKRLPIAGGMHLGIQHPVLVIRMGHDFSWEILSGAFISLKCLIRDSRTWTLINQNPPTQCPELPGC